MHTMASNAINWWSTAGVRALDELAAAHRAVGGTGRGRRYATQQINNAYAIFLSAQFQRCCRDLHSEVADYLSRLAPTALRSIVLQRLTEGRKLDTGNPNPANLGSDFGRFGLDFWRELDTADPANVARRSALAELSLWRNALAHQDFARPELRGRTGVVLQDVRRWRRACDALTRQFDAILRTHLTSLSGAAPW
jgi:hypothetical protein